MRKKILFFLFIFLINFNSSYSKNSEEFYKKIDLFSEVLDKIQNEYVDEVDQAEMMDSAINGVLRICTGTSAEAFGFKPCPQFQ